MEYVVATNWKQQLSFGQVITTKPGDKVEVLDFDPIAQKYFIKFGTNILTWVHWSTAQKNILDLNSENFK